MDGLLDDLSQLRRGAATLRILTSDNPAQQRRVDGLDLLIDRLFKQAHLVTQMAAVQGLAQVAAAPESIELSSGFRAVARTLGEMTAEEDRLMTLRTEDARLVSRRSTAATTTGSVVIFWLLVIGFYNVRLSTRANRTPKIWPRVAKTCRNSTRLWSSGYLSEPPPFSSRPAWSVRFLSRLPKV